MKHRQVTVGDASLHVIEAGDPAAPPVLFLHGWPQSAQSWAPVLELAAETHHALAVDLPGIGGSTGATDGSKRAVAEVVRLLIERLGLRRPLLAGHDLGGMVVYAYLRRYHDLGRAVIMNTVLPGVAPWDEVLRNPYLWHFALHAVPDLPEQLVTGRERPYFDHFFDVLSPDPAAIGEAERAAAVAAYRGPALRAGFDLYRALTWDAADNELCAQDGPAPTPVLYVRGEHEPGDPDAYVKGLADAGVTDVECAVVPGAGHFAPTENPRAVWDLVRRFQ
ncbi:alpha/beta fold hydrolase [Spirilliplanes yamanashiensis]|uniref:Alpha/beta hydrolase n=1 Tax=Spirilliplanes yamanashiensis TaxID=42233 RepID=A0A8J3Y9C4_9ACTN|nr:alpha/beta hydrolase [Spirilliplanes yamanashiensis]MDP9816033.1 pimeloyl-ACP methyl ester carboxylesterase [Spirilliplanes yamanashiensis]GIJ04293.1 alpha/beta hydrolase [Spirilliplanes yamanashiensis]